MKSRPIIGITPLFDYERDSLWLLPGYMDGIEEAGGLPIMLGRWGAGGPADPPAANLR